MAAVRHCSECPAALVNADGSPKPSGTKTCSKEHRQARARRLKREAKERAQANASLPPGLAEASQVTSGKVKDAMHEVIKEELRPKVQREVMTERVLGGIERMIGMTPEAIELLHQHMQSSDETIAQRAVTLLLKYTLGNPSVAPPPKEQAPGGLTVQFNVPRPDDAPVEVVTAEAVPVTETAEDVGEIRDAEEVRECLDCHKVAPASQFVAASQRCIECSDGMRELLREKFGDAYSG